MDDVLLHSLDAGDQPLVRAFATLNVPYKFPNAHF